MGLLTFRLCEAVCPVYQMPQEDIPFITWCIWVLEMKKAGRFFARPGRITFQLNFKSVAACGKLVNVIEIVEEVNHTIGVVIRVGDAG